ncbi:MAG: HlyD family efflux transporter periplasmic adaptor subunit, partial [Deltaproteobacteria bacterium]|nr:HlyD family efflux transporter periplasmic adaptor subunit [Deltaproteobacteria bacterium]
QKVKDIISRDEYERLEGEIKQYETELKVSGHQISELIALKKQINQEIAYIKEEYRSRLLTELSTAKQRYLYLQGRIEKGEFVSTQQQITSPVSGYVSRLLFHTVGGVVTPAEKLAYIVPDHSPLLIKATLLSKDAGFVSEDMAASIKIDTFSFQKYGTINGKVVQVSKDSIEDERLGLIYDIYIDPEKSTLIVDGVETPITVGMGVTAEVKVGKRRIIEFFIYPLIKYMDEGISVR